MLTRISIAWLVASSLSTAISAAPPPQQEGGYGQAPQIITITRTKFISVIGSTCPTIPTTTIFSYVPAATTTITTTATTSICPACTAGEGGPEGGFEGKQEITGSNQTENIPLPPPVDMLPAVPAHVDLKDMSNLTPGKDCTLHYRGESKEQGTSGAYVTFPDLTYATVVLEHTAYVSQVSCSTATQISITFSNKSAFDHAFQTWSAEIRNKFVLITYAPTCGSGQDGERDFLLVSALDESKDGSLTITAAIKKISLKEASNMIEVNFGRVDTSNTVNAAAAVSSTPFPYNSNFDQELDDKLGYLDQNSPDFWSQLLPGVQDVNGFRGSAGLARRDFWSNLGDVLKNAADKVVSGIQNVVNTITNAVTNVANDIIPPLALGPFSFSAFPDSQVDTPFGKGVLLFQNLTSASTGATNSPQPGVTTSTDAGVPAALTGYCVGCGVNGNFSLTGTVKFSPTLGIASANFSLNGVMHAQIALGIVGEVDATAQAQVNLVTVGLTPLQILGIVVVGPSVGLDVGAMANVKLVGEIEVGYAFDWPAISAQVDILHPQQAVATGFTPNATPIFQADVALTVDASIFALVGIRLGIDVLSGKFTADVGLVDKPSIDAVAIAHRQVNDSANGLPNGVCGGAGLTIGVSDVLFVEAAAHALDLLEATTTWPIGSWSKGLFSTSISGCAGATPHSTTVVTATTVSTGEVPTAAQEQPTIFPSIMNKTTTAAPTLTPYNTQSLISTTTLSPPSTNETTATSTPTITPAPTTYKNPTTTSTSTPSTTLLLNSATTYTNPTHQKRPLPATANLSYDPTSLNIYASSSLTPLPLNSTTLLLHTYNTTLPASRFRIAPIDHIPKTSVVLTLAPVTLPDSKGSSVVAVSPSGEVYYLISCTYPDSEAAKEGAKVFLAKEPKAGIAALVDPGNRGTVTGGDVVGCEVFLS